ncbi:MAG: hypothetical protein EOM66_08810, partial [Clostridia bacterium]|nr:hypothetical protein [Clostridia bacterium]
MRASQQDIMTAKLFFNAAFPVMQVLLDDDPKLHKKFEHFKATVQFGAKNEDELLCCHLIFDDGNVRVVQGPATQYDLALTFPTIEKMNALLRGGMALPSIKGKLSLLPPVLSILMGLMIMSPKKVPKDFAGQALKVKCSLYMITRALSQYNKLGDPHMQEFCRRQPDRIYQFTVKNGEDPHYIACYLRIAAGKSKSGHGVYTRRSPFVHFSFKSVEGALKVLLKEVAFVEGVEKGYVESIGSPEYACYLN